MRMRIRPVEVLDVPRALVETLEQRVLAEQALADSPFFSRHEVGAPGEFDGQAARQASSAVQNVQAAQMTRAGQMTPYRP